MKRVEVGQVWKAKPPRKERVEVRRVWEHEGTSLARCHPLHGGRALVISASDLEAEFLPEPKEGSAE